MHVTISSEVLDAVVAEARRQPDVEVCGLLFGDGLAITGHQRCTNVASDTSASFEIDPYALIQAQKHARSGGPAILGHYHSHPHGPATPSARDAAAAASDASLWLIVGAKTVGFWRAISGGGHLDKFDAIDVVVEPRACVTP